MSYLSYHIIELSQIHQELIKVGGYDEKQKSEVGQLEKKIEYLQQVCLHYLTVP